MDYNPFPPPPPLPPSSTPNETSNFAVITNLSTECHQLRIELVKKSKEFEEQQVYINELEETVRDLGDELDLKNILIEKLSKEIESLEKVNTDIEKQKAKQLSIVYKTHNEDLDALILELMDSEKENANLRAQLSQAEEQLNAKDSLILDLKEQLREFSNPIESKSVLETTIEEVILPQEPDSHLKPDVPSESFQLPNSHGLKLKTSLGSLTGIMKKKFSESEDEDDLSPEGMTIRRDLSNKTYNRIKSGQLSESLYPRSVSFVHDLGARKETKKESSTPDSNSDQANVGSKSREKSEENSWKNSKKHLNVFQRIELNMEKSYFNWESGDSAPNTPEKRKVNKRQSDVD